jgi:uncharacterized protein
MAERRLFDWGQAKAASNLAKHGVDFEFGMRVFLDENHIEIDVSRERDAEQRLKAIGAVDGSLFSVVFTLRDDVRRIISVRRSNRSEEKAYGDRSLQT